MSIILFCYPLVPITHLNGFPRVTSLLHIQGTHGYMVYYTSGV